MEFPCFGIISSPIVPRLFAKKERIKPCKQMKTHVLILDSTAAWENPTDFTPVKARGALVVKAAAPATRERATANFILSYTITSMTKSEQRRFFVVILSFESEDVDALSTSPAPIKYFGAKHACTKKGSTDGQTLRYFDW